MGGAALDGCLRKSILDDLNSHGHAKKCFCDQSMDPTRLRGYTPDEFERICLELARQALGSSVAMRRGGISDPHQGIDIEAKWGLQVIGIQCKAGKLTVPVLRDALRQLIRYPNRIDRSF